MKKVLSFVLVLVMMMTMSLSALAASVSIKDHPGDDAVLNGHTFAAYQILKGDYHLDGGEETLSNIAWGDGIDYVDLVAELKLDAYDGVFGGKFDSLNTDLVSCPSDLANILVTFSASSAQIEKFIEIALKHLAGSGIALSTSGTDVADGYYLIVDTTNVDGKYEVKNAALLQVLGEDIEINAKVEKPPLEKKVKENTEYTSDGGYGTGYNDVATYSIGDTVPFALYSVVPDLTQYTEYEMIFKDNLSKGLTLDADSIKVTIAGVEITKGTTSGGVHTGDYHVSVTPITTANQVLPHMPEGNTLISVHIPDLKTITINDGSGDRAVKAGDEIVVTYNTVLNKNAVVGTPGNLNTAYLNFSNDPDSDSHGKTPDDQVIVFTMGLELDKVDGGNTTHKLKGVEFVVWKDDAKSAFAIVDANKRFAGWVKATDVADENPYNYSSAEYTAVYVTDTNGNVSIYGLDNGTYYIEETKALAGYNAIIGLIPITIDADVVYGQTWDLSPATALKGLAGDTDSDWLTEKQIVNHGGTVLPETGGMGTVLFIAVGCVLILGASVVMVTRKKMSVYAD